MRVRVPRRGRTVRGPTRVRHPAVALKHQIRMHVPSIRRQKCRQIRKLPRHTKHLGRTLCVRLTILDREPRGVVPSVFQALEPSQELGDDLLLGLRAVVVCVRKDPTHGADVRRER